MSAFCFFAFFFFCSSGKNFCKCKSTFLRRINTLVCMIWSVRHVGNSSDGQSMKSHNFLDFFSLHFVPCWHNFILLLLFLGMYQRDGVYMKMMKKCEHKNITANNTEVSYCLSSRNRNRRTRPKTDWNKTEKKKKKKKKSDTFMLHTRGE